MKRQRRYEPQKCNDGKNYLIWDNETGQCLGFIAEIVGRLNLQNDIIQEQKEKLNKNNEKASEGNRFVMVEADLPDGKEISINDTEEENAQILYITCDENDLFFCKQEVENVLYRLNFQNNWINQLTEKMNRQKKELKIKWADQIDEISELLIQHYNVAMKDEDYPLIEELNEIIDEFESIDSKYIKNR